MTGQLQPTGTDYIIHALGIANAWRTCKPSNRGILTLS